MSGDNRLNGSFSNLGQQYVQDIGSKEQTAAPKQVDNKLRSLLSSVIAKVKGNTPVETKQRTHSVAPKNQSVQTLIASVKSLFSSKVHNHANNNASSVKENGIPHTIKNLFSRDGSFKRQQFISEFKSTVLACPNPQGKSATLQATVAFLEKAEKAGVLDQTLYNSITRSLSPNLKDRRQSISLDDLDKAPTQKTVHQELMHATSMSDNLRTKLDSLNLVKPLQALKQQLQPAAEIDRATGEKIIDKVLEAYPPLTEIEMEIDGKKHTAILLTNSGKPEVLIKKEELGRGAATIAYKAISLASQTPVVVMYETAASQGSNEKENAIATLKHLGEHEGIQKPLQLMTLQSQDGPKKVTVTELYEHRDFGNDVLVGQFFKEFQQLVAQTTKGKETLNIEGTRDLNKLKDFIKDCLTGPATKEEKMEFLKVLSSKYSSLLIAMTSSPEKVSEFLKVCQRLIEN